MASATSECERLARTVCSDFAALSLQNVGETKSALDDRCDFMLTKLDAFIQLIKSVGEQQEFLMMNLPKVLAAREYMKDIYAQIDQLENLVSDVKSTVTAMEQKVEESEKQFTTSYQKKIFKVLQSALGSSFSGEDQYHRQVKFIPPEIFRIDDYFPERSTTIDGGDN